MNTTRKYDLDTSYFKNIDTEFKAWILGWIASDGCIGKNIISIALHKKDIDVLKLIQRNICKEIPIVEKSKTILSYTICSKEIMNDILNHLNLDTYGKKSNKLSNINIDEILIQHFIRGFFEGDGYIKKSRAPECGIASNSEELLDYIINSTDIPCKKYDNSIKYYGINALDFLGRIYNNANYKMKRKYELYEDICLWEPKIDGPKNSSYINKVFFCKTRKDAPIPFKERVSDSGYDLTLLSLEKKIGEVELYDTGIKVTPQFGYYFDLVPRSSIIKSGYILANSIGIIDRTYLGAIKVPLIKVDKNAPDIELPNRLVQIVPRKINHFEFVEVENLEDTSRMSGGFGSTNKDEK